nr:immunoglobulin heavy chain junction region [Mus musculus]
CALDSSGPFAYW